MTPEKREKIRKKKEHFEKVQKSYNGMLDFFFYAMQKESAQV
jgi:hypothetical protein